MEGRRHKGYKEDGRWKNGVFEVVGWDAHVYSF